jgi:small subunit ribosomal protein S16
MLTIRMKRTGRSGHAQFRVVVQDSRFSPTSGRVVAYLGSYDPHAKTTTLDKVKASSYLENGAQPSDRVVRLLKSEGVTLPAWVKEPDQKQRTTRKADKRRSTAPKQEKKPEEEAPDTDAAESTPEAEVPAEAAPATEVSEEVKEPEAAEKA